MVSPFLSFGRVDGECLSPSALEKGIRSERALKLAAITEDCCGVSISSTQVSRAVAPPGEELDHWRNPETQHRSTQQ